MERVEVGYSLEHHVEGKSRHLGAPLLKLELARELEELKRGEPWRLNGHAAKTLAKYPDLRVVLIALRKGTRLGEHMAREQTSLHTLEGHVRVMLPSQVVDLPAGYLLGIERSLSHDIEAVEDSAILLTLPWTGEPGTAH